MYILLCQGIISSTHSLSFPIGAFRRTPYTRSPKLLLPITRRRILATSVTQHPRPTWNRKSWNYPPPPHTKPQNPQLTLQQLSVLKKNTTRTRSSLQLSTIPPSPLMSLMSLTPQRPREGCGLWFPSQRPV